MRTFVRGLDHCIHLTEPEFLAVQADALAHPEKYKAGVKEEPIDDPGNEIKFFSGAKSLGQALGWYKTFWPYGVKLAREIAPVIRPRLKALAGHMAEVSREVPAISGRRLNMSAVIQDTGPEHFYRERLSEAASAGGRKLVNIYVDIAAPSCVEAKTLAHFGLSLAESISVIESYNIARFRITLVQLSEHYKDNRTLSVIYKLKDYHQSIPRARLITAIAAPFMLRRFILNLEDRVQELDASNYAYGCAIKDSSRAKTQLRKFITKESVNVLYSSANIPASSVMDFILEPLSKELKLKNL